MLSCIHAKKQEQGIEVMPVASYRTARDPIANPLGCHLLFLLSRTVEVVLILFEVASILGFRQWFDTRRGGYSWVFFEGEESV